ncbi:hypothetical protein [Ornithinimicrobium flavum]|uniref:hypothetical protein n=1 Tax=Ornithinimicrobium flavum TaxID=1288636 RepID=UPI00106F8CD1|nr:hypothetical protein [Ornithinimicrobium flavum]
MSGVLTFPDGESVVDLATFVGRARNLDADGAVRLQAVGEVLAVWVCVLPGQGILRTGLVLGLRTMRLAGEHRLDVTVPLGALTDRFARRASTGDPGTALPVPPGEVAPPWAAVSPPRGGWEPAGTIAVATLRQAAQDGIAEVAQGAPEGSGSAAVEALRHRVWGRPVDLRVPAGTALAVHALGFAPAGRSGDAATVHRAGPWVRLSLPAGHVLART